MGEVKVSIVIAVLNSHEVVIRQIRHFKRMRLADTVEIILVDDGSNPPLSFENCGLRNLRILYTNDKRPWTQGLARNMGARAARGEYIFFTDIDHILTSDAIQAALETEKDKVVPMRYYGILGPHGNIISDEKSMVEFGLNPIRVRTRRGYLCAGVHGNTYAIRKTVFNRIGGYPERLCTRGYHMGGKTWSEESWFNVQFERLHDNNEVTAEIRGKVYFYPVGKFRLDRDTNPYGLFHGLSLEQVPQPMKE